MRVRIYPAGSVEGEVEAPPSKSYSHRVLFAALLADGASRVVNLLASRDVDRSKCAVRRFGARVRGDKVEPPTRLKPPPHIYCGGSGTTMRICTAVAALGGGPTLLYGDSTLNRRPMAPLLRSLESLGAQVMSRDGMPPIAVYAPRGLRGGRVEVDASISSQYVTALLLVGPMLGVELEVKGRLRSRPYVDITLKVMEAFGAKVQREGYQFFYVAGSGYRQASVSVPGDYSSAAFMLAAGALRGRVRVYGLDPEDVQGDKAILEVLKMMGARVRWSGGVVEAESTGELEGVEVDCGDTPDLAPVISVLAAYARGVTRLKNVGHLAFKESNRLISIKQGLERMGCTVIVEGEDLIVRGCKRLRGARLAACGDHRIAMALAVAAIGAEGPSEISGFHRVADSYPQFLEHIRRLGVKVEVM